MLSTTYSFDYQWPNIRSRFISKEDNYTPEGSKSLCKLIPEEPNTEDIINRLEWVPTGRMGRLLFPQLLPTKMTKEDQLRLQQMAESDDFNFMQYVKSPRERKLKQKEQNTKYKLYSEIQEEKIREFKSAMIGRTIAMVKEQHERGKHPKLMREKGGQRNAPRMLSQQEVLATKMDSIQERKAPPLNRYKQASLWSDTNIGI